MLASLYVGRERHGGEAGAAAGALAKNVRGSCGTSCCLGEIQSVMTTYRDIEVAINPSDAGSCMVKFANGEIGEEKFAALLRAQIKKDAPAND